MSRSRKIAVPKLSPANAFSVVLERFQLKETGLDCFPVPHIFAYKFFIGNALVDLFLQSRNWPFGAAVSTAMVAIMFVTIALYMRFVLSRGDVRRAALV